MRTAKVILRIFDKKTHATYRMAWPCDICISMATGTKRLVLHTPGYSTFNEYGMPVLSSWTVPLTLGFYNESARSKLYDFINRLINKTTLGMANNSWP